MSNMIVITCRHAAFVSFPVAVINYPGKSNLRGKGLILLTIQVTKKSEDSVEYSGTTVIDGCEPPSILQKSILWC